MISCPRDGAELIGHTEAARPVWHCNTCGGAFIKELPIQEFQSIGTQQAREEWDCEIKCPEHREKMTFLTVKGVTIDICPKCNGVWLDGDEIETLLGSVYSQKLANHGSIGGAWSEADILTPLVDAALSALFHG